MRLGCLQGESAAQFHACRINSELERCGFVLCLYRLLGRSGDEHASHWQILHHHRSEPSLVEAYRSERECRGNDRYRSTRRCDSRRRFCASDDVYGEIGVRPRLSHDGNAVRGPICRRHARTSARDRARRLSDLAYPVKADTHYMWRAPLENSRKSWLDEIVEFERRIIHK